MATTTTTKRKSVVPPKASEDEKKLKSIKQEPIEPEKVEEEEEEEEESEEEEEEEEEEEKEESGSGEEEEEESEDEDEEEEDEEEDESSKRENLRKLLEPFGKDQIIEFLKEAALKDRSIFNAIAQSADSDPVHRKVFVFGLGWDATTEQVLSVLNQYGEIEECKVVTDKATGRAKGYAFVQFKTRAGALKAIKQRQMKIGNRMTSCQLASSGPVPNNNPVPDSTGRKIYVANVGPSVNQEKLRSFFAKFGEIDEGPLGRDPSTGKFKGFAIFLYKSAEGCKKALEEPFKDFEGVQLQCRRAVEGHRNNNNNNKSQTNVASVQQQTDVNTMNYGMLGHNINPAAVMMGQNPMGINLTNPLLASALNQYQSGGLNPSLGFNGNFGVNNISPSVMAAYGSQAALQGMGAYQSAQLGNSSAGATGAAAATRPQSGFGAMGTTFPTYYGR